MKAETAIPNTYVDGKPFTITGDTEAIMEQKERADAYLEALQAAEKAQTGKLAGTAIKAVQTAPETLTGRKAAITAKLFDIVYKDNSYEELKARRLAEKRLKHRQRIGLITTDRCAKHERLLKQVSRQHKRH